MALFVSWLFSDIIALYNIIIITDDTKPFTSNPSKLFFKHLDMCTANMYTIPILIT